MSWWKNVGSALFLYLAVGFAAVQGYNMSNVERNTDMIEQNTYLNEHQESEIESNSSAITSAQNKLFEIEKQLQALLDKDDSNLSTRSPGCLCIKASNEGEQVKIFCPTKGPVCDGQNRQRCEEENPGYEC